VILSQSPFYLFIYLLLDLIYTVVLKIQLLTSQKQFCGYCGFNCVSVTWYFRYGTT